MNATAISRNDGFVISLGGNRTAKKTTRGWELCVEWKDGTSDWVKLKDLKDTNPVELAEYAVAIHFVDEPAFQWWVPLTLKKRNHVIAKAKSKYWRTTHKFGIRVPKSIDNAYLLMRRTVTVIGPMRSSRRSQRSRSHGKPTTKV